MGHALLFSSPITFHLPQSPLTAMPPSCRRPRRHSSRRHPLSNTRIIKSELEIKSLLEKLTQTEESYSHLKHEAKQFQLSLKAFYSKKNYHWKPWS